MRDDLRVRTVAIVAATILVAGCGASKTKQAASPKPQVRGDSYTVVLKPVGPIGRWVKLFLSNDGKTWLAQWSGECEVQSTYFIPARGGKPRPVTGHETDESVALGWALHNRARVLLPRPACGSRYRRPGIYLIDRQGDAIFVKPVKSRLGGP
jgi:hypothetical protein